MLNVRVCIRPWSLPIHTPFGEFLCTCWTDNPFSSSPLLLDLRTCTEDVVLMQSAVYAYEENIASDPLKVDSTRALSLKSCFALLSKSTVG